MQLVYSVFNFSTLCYIMKDFVIEALRSIAELITYGDQHDTAFFECGFSTFFVLICKFSFFYFPFIFFIRFFMEKQVMGEFVRILKISRTSIVSLQLLQTMSIMIQNLKSEHSIYYMFSNEHINYFITYSFDFRNEELLSFYISFLRAISGKLNKNTISVLVKTRNVRALCLDEPHMTFFHDYLNVEVRSKASCRPRNHSSLVSSSLSLFYKAVTVVIAPHHIDFVFTITSNLCRFLKFALLITHFQPCRAPYS
ncbi:unnamed protein product [Ilex paraguariensis]|uniref:FPL domain-containing protein n=1 Tax=Ilex paraguariensis TaxID=185542 RepID=A0ABC8TQZ2_9AQUA